MSNPQHPSFPGLFAGKNRACIANWSLNKTVFQSDVKVYTENDNNFQYNYV